MELEGTPYANSATASSKRLSQPSSQPSSVRSSSTSLSLNDLLRPCSRSIQKTGRNANLNYGSVAILSTSCLRSECTLPGHRFSRLALPGTAIPAAGTAHQGKKYLFGFLTASIFAFACGVAISYFTLPRVVYALKFTPANESNSIDAGVYISFILKFVVTFSCAFIIPVILVGVNMLGLIRGKTILKSWRWVVVLVAVIAALTAPGSDIMMIPLQTMAPLLFSFAAIGICMINDSAATASRKLAQVRMK